MKKKLKINILFIVLFVLIIFTFGYFSVTLNNLQTYLLNSEKRLDTQLEDLNNKVDLINDETQNTINQLSNSLMETQESLTETQSSLEKQISSIKAQTSADFSGIIEDAVKAVVTIRTDKAQGTGFIISKDGYLVTNQHVIDDAIYAEAITSNQEKKSLSLVGYNSKMDIALLKIEGDYNYLRFDDSEDVKIGEKVIAIGNPLGLSFSVTEGIISAIHRKIEDYSGSYIQTDAALNSGNSGGPLINTEGRVIGINNFKVKGDNIGFALESNLIIDEVNKISLVELEEELL